mmetsp:Transcript_1260/g.3210  ORF Transcript_1260/g.3210 Transcript_1260/m.3210 type:complete len:305 (-) Transcript_1260:66-980(-)
MGTAVSDLQIIGVLRDVPGMFFEAFHRPGSRVLFFFLLARFASQVDKLQRVGATGLGKWRGVVGFSCFWIARIVLPNHREQRPGKNSTCVDIIIKRICKNFGYIDAFICGHFVVVLCQRGKGNVRRNVSRAIGSVVVFGLHLGTGCAVHMFPIKILRTVVRSSCTGLPEKGSPEVKGVLNINVRWIPSEGGIGSTEFLGEVQGCPAPIGTSIVAKLDVVNSLLVLIDAPGGECRLDQVSNVWKFVRKRGIRTYEFRYRFRPRCKRCGGKSSGKSCHGSPLAPQLDNHLSFSSLIGERRLPCTVC